MRKPFHSIRWRLQAWYGLVLLLVIVAFCLTAYRLALDTQMRRLDADLGRLDWSLFHILYTKARAIPQSPTEPQQDTPMRIPALLRSGKITLSSSDLELFKGTEPGYAYFCMQDADGTVLAKSPNAPEGIELPKDFKPAQIDISRDAPNRRERLHVNPGGKSIIGRDIRPEQAEMRKLAWSLGLLGCTVWSLGLLGGWWIAGRAISPIARISHTAKRIAEGKLNERIGAPDTDSELDELCRVLDRTFERLREAFEKQKQFTADASHELRTPVTILLSETQRILKRPRTEQEYKDAILTCQEAAQRMRRLTEALLLLARQDGPDAEKQRSECDLAQCVQEALQQHEAQAQSRNINLVPMLNRVACIADPAALSILAANLISNAIQYNKEGGTVWIETRLEAGVAIFSVADDGPGIPGESLPRIFDRFYRVDKARGPQGSNAGIGLSIAKSIVDNHRGTISVESAPGRGAHFTVRLPLGAD